MRPGSLQLFLVALLALLAPRAVAADVSVAAAANFTSVLKPLNAAFQRTAAEVRVTTTVGASGGLFAQVLNGAPFDIILFADTTYPAELARRGAGDPTTQRIVATGRLVLWAPHATGGSIQEIVTSPAVRKLAVANAQTAPYGRAALAALDTLGLTAAVRGRLVVGENIAQTAQFVETGNADAGFVALSLLSTPELRARGRWIEIPAELYPSVSLAHVAILTQRGTSNPAARRYLEFLSSPAARAILEQHGYRGP